MMRRRAFTLVELIVVSVIGVLLAGAVLTSVSSLQRARAASLGRAQAHGRADAAASSIALDLSNLTRDYDLAGARLAIVSGGQPGAEQDDLLMLCQATRSVRGEAYTPEGEQVEVQYRVQPVAGAPVPALWRRADPGHDLYLDAGGVATALVGGVVSLKVEAYDGTDWFDEWDSDSDGYPHAVRVTVIGSSDDQKTQALSRRVVAIDRVPLPPPAAGSSSTGTTSGSAGGTSTGGAR